eukprot:15256120-Alexandrium_andersonii.AAC.1
MRSIQRDTAQRAQHKCGAMRTRAARTSSMEHPAWTHASKHHAACAMTAVQHIRHELLEGPQPLPTTRTSTQRSD